MGNFYRKMILFASHVSNAVIISVCVTHGSNLTYFKLNLSTRDGYYISHKKTQCIHNAITILRNLYYYHLLTFVVINNNVPNVYDIKRLHLKRFGV